MQSDQRGLPLTVANEAAAEHYRSAVERYFEYRLDTMQHVKAALQADPGFVMAHCLRGCLFMLFSTTAVYPRVRESLAACEARIGSVTPREARHVAALRAWLAGDWAAAIRIWDEILFEHPTDLLALRLQHFLTFWTGQSQALRGRVAQVFPSWDEGLPGYGYMLGMLSFGLEECGDYATAERYGKRAVELNREDLWAVHAVAHVLEMQGRLQEGMAWLDYPADAWDDRNPFRGHLWWHSALFPLELGDYDRVLALYDRSIRDDQSDFYLDMQNAASLLLRLEFQGVDVGDRWHELADHAETHIDDHTLPFTDLHHMLALVRDGRRAAAEKLLASLRAFAGTPDNSAAATMERATLPLCEAMVACGQGDHERAVETLLNVRYDYDCVGGSYAQRDLFAQLLIESAIMARRFSLARALLAERVALKPMSRGAWRKYAAVLSNLGDQGAAKNAAQRGEAPLGR
ncbi:MAG: tetratricopeptide repeat protein [Kiloniellales bacterium]